MVPTAKAPVQEEEKEVLVVDGSQGEGGGQLLRNALTYAALLNRGVRIYNIRGKRPRPGLQPQHATALRLIQQINSSGNLLGNDRDSTEIQYTPHPVADKQASHVEAATERTWVGDTGTAGSIVLLLQAALPCALWGRSAVTHLILKGGTNATFAPQFDYWQRVFWPTLSRRGGLTPDHVQAHVRRRGFFPQGGGEVHVRVNPLTTTLAPIHLTDRGEVAHLSIRAFHAGKIPRKAAEEMAQAAESCWRNHRPAPAVPLTTEIVTEPHAVGSGLGILLVAETTTGCWLGGNQQPVVALCAPNQKPAQAGQSAAQELLQTLADGGCVDEWLQDQLILYMALAGGQSQVLTGSLTQHTQTAVAMAEKLSGAQFTVTPLNDDVAPTTTTEGPVSSDATADNSGRYGQPGRIPGKHLVQCQGIGLAGRPGLF